MPIYLFENSKGIIKEVFFCMSDNKTYKGENGKEEDWSRLWTSPAAKIDSFDPWDEKKFVKKTGEMKGGTMNDLFNESAALSKQRADKLGHEDPKKTKYFAEQKKIRNGKPCGAEIKERNSKTITI